MSDNSVYSAPCLKDKLCAGCYNLTDDNCVEKHIFSEKILGEIINYL